MKKLLLFAFLLLTIANIASAQTRQVFNLNKLSKNDTLLTGWVFHTGDNQHWVNPAFDDSKWRPVDPGQDVQHFDALKKAGIAWFRLHVVVDSTLAGKILAVRVTQYTASEIYLNGKLIAKYGTVSADPAKVKGYLTSDKPFVIQLLPGKENIIALRVAYEPGLTYISTLFYALPAVALNINSYQAAQANYLAGQERVKSFLVVFALCGGAVLIIFFIYLVYFLFDRSKKVNLYYALFCASVCYITLPNEFWGIDRFGSLSTQMWLAYTEGILFIVGMGFLLLTIYALFNYKRRSIFVLLLVIGAASAIYMYFDGTTGFLISTDAVPLIFLIEGVRVCIWAIRRQMKDAVYVLAGNVLFVALVIWSNQLDQSTVLAQLLWGAGIICFPVGMSFYLGIQGAITNKQLAASLIEVQSLSEQKQQILADQNILLEQQVEERTTELNQSLTDLRSTQTQLIQSEKMASLGELTAGIAHEIQNPLNFVNNFSEVNTELLDEMEQEINKGHFDEVKSIAGDIKKNQEKISQHGKRADFIVKGMLEHSRTSTGEKQPTNLNVLCDEFLKLSYHGLRAKDKSFNAEMIIHFDENLPKANIAAQDIGRVLLNLVNNAFYAVNQKKKTAGADYKPEVSVSTGYENGQIIIKVKDNGTGIPDAIKEKIMQPFFTTKPTGEGTGLGLSLSYDIVVKGHGGTIDIRSTAGQGAEFIITLPVS